MATVVDSSGKTEVYVNGQIAYHTVYGTPESPFTSVIAPTELFIGAGYEGERYFSGMIDEVAIYDTALTQSQLAAHYTAAIGGTGPLEGDLTEDGLVGSADLDLVRGNWGRTDASGIAEGDATGDGVVGSADLDVVRANWGATAGAAVPEPFLPALLFVTLAAIGIRRKDTRPPC